MFELGQRWKVKVDFNNEFIIESIKHRYPTVNGGLSGKLILNLSKNKFKYNSDNTYYISPNDYTIKGNKIIHCAWEFELLKNQSKIEV